MRQSSQFHSVPAWHDVRLGVISNPTSGRNRKQIGAIRGILARYPDVHHVITSDGGEIAAAVDSFEREGVNLLAVNGGDGSVAQLLTELCTRNSDKPLPLLCVLPGGTTNVTANDIGLRGKLQQALRALLSWRRDGSGNPRLLERPVIRVRSTSGETLGCGLVFGTGAVVSGIEFWQREMRSRGMRSELSSGFAAIRTVCGMLDRRSGFAPPLPMRFRCTENGEAQSGEFMLLVVSALQRLFLGIHPFWGESEGALHFTAIEQGAPAFLRSLPGILRGAPAARVCSGNGYHSRMLDRLEIEFNGGFTLDGELHRVEPDDAPLCVSNAGPARFLRV